MSKTFTRVGLSNEIVCSEERYNPVTGEKTNPNTQRFTVEQTEGEVARLEEQLKEKSELLTILRSVPMPEEARVVEGEVLR